MVRQSLKDSWRRAARRKDAAVFQGRLTKFKDQLPEVKRTANTRRYSTRWRSRRASSARSREVLERMLEADAIAADLKEAEAALARQQKDIAAEKATLDAELVLVQKSLADVRETCRAHEGCRAASRRVVRPGVARARKGIAISMATRDGSCSICHVGCDPLSFSWFGRTIGSFSAKAASGFSTTSRLLLPRRLQPHIRRDDVNLAGFRLDR